MVGEIDGPAFSCAARLRVGRDGGKLVEKFLVIFRRGGLGVRVGLRDSIEDDDAITQVDVVAGHADEPLDEKKVLRLAVGVKFGSATGLMKTTMSPRRGSR